MEANLSEIQKIGDFEFIHPLISRSNVFRKKVRGQGSFLNKSPKVSGTKNAGTEPCKAILGVGFPLHKPYSLYRFAPPNSPDICIV